MSVHRTKQDREICPELPLEYPESYFIMRNFEWIETPVWTEKMLTALVKGLQGEKWYSLIDKVYSESNLKSAWEKVKRNKGCAGIDRQSVYVFSINAEKYLSELREDLLRNEYNPNQIKRVWIPKGNGKNRPLGIPTVKDRIVQTALRNVLEPIFENSFNEHSYGFRPERSCRDALREVDTLLKSGYKYVAEFDIVSFFDNVNHEILLKKINEKISDTRILNLIELYLKQNIVEEAERWTPERGTPQGAVISPLLSNIYLDILDEELERRGYNYIRYADDGVILCQTKEQAEQALKDVEELLSEIQLEIHPDKSKIIDIDSGAGFNFLGYYFFKYERENRIIRYCSKKSLSNFRDKIRRQTRRLKGISLEAIIANVNKILKGWFEYFKHCYKFTFTMLDGWIRMRLRRILCKRINRAGNGKGAYHQKYKNSYFVERGLFSLKEAHARTCRSR